MYSSTFTQLVSSPFRLTTSKDEQPPPLCERIYTNDPKSQTMISPNPSEPFPIAQLPYELRQLIYTHCFASLPTRNITCSNARLPHNSLTPLALASQFLKSDPIPNLYYRHTRFSFSCPGALKTFSKTLSSYSENDRRKDVRKVTIMSGDMTNQQETGFIS
jgi:hypothetical protein